MNPFPIAVLFWPTVVIFLVVLVVTNWFTRHPASAFLAACVKSGLFLVYFGIIFDGSFTFSDDLHYLEGGSLLLSSDVSITNLGTHWDVVLAVGGGRHFAYYLYNAYAFRIFGQGYYAPVACNILLTVLVAYFGARLASNEFKMTRRSINQLYLFLLLHPDILAWSTIMNGKDILVLLLHVFMLYSVSLFFRRRLFVAALIAAPVVTILLFVRFYVPVLFAVALIAVTLLKKPMGGSASRRRSLVGVALLAGILYGLLGVASFQQASALAKQDVVSPLFGLLRFILTPIPFHTSPSYAFLNVPSLLHWVLMPFFIVGAVYLARRSKIFHVFLLLYLLLFVALYAVYGELQGPRHRVQLDYAWGLLQFIGLAVAIRRTRCTRLSSDDRVGSVSAAAGSPLRETLP